MWFRGVIHVRHNFESSQDPLQSNGLLRAVCLSLAWSVVHLHCGMAGNTAATTEATTAIYRWTRNSIIVKVVKQNEKGEDIKTISCSSCCDEQKKTSGDDDSMMIVNEGYAGIAEIKNVEILHLTNPPGDCPDGKLCVKTKDPLFGCSIETGPCKFKYKAIYGQAK